MGATIKLINAQNALNALRNTYGSSRTSAPPNTPRPSHTPPQQSPQREGRYSNWSFGSYGNDPAHDHSVIAVDQIIRDVNAGSDTHMFVSMKGSQPIRDGMAIEIGSFAVDGKDKIIGKLAEHGIAASLDDKTLKGHIGATHQPSHLIIHFGENGGKDALVGKLDAICGDRLKAPFKHKDIEETEQAARSGSYQFSNVMAQYAEALIAETEVMGPPLKAALDATMENAIAESGIPRDHFATNPLQPHTTLEDRNSPHFNEMKANAKAIASSLREAGVSGADFYSIESTLKVKGAAASVPEAERHHERTREAYEKTQGGTEMGAMKEAILGALTPHRTPAPNASQPNAGERENAGKPSQTR